MSWSSSLEHPQGFQMSLSFLLSFSPEWFDLYGKRQETKPGSMIAFWHVASKRTEMYIEPVIFLCIQRQNSVLLIFQTPYHKWAYPVSIFRKSTKCFLVLSQSSKSIVFVLSSNSYFIMQKIFLFILRFYHLSKMSRLMTVKLYLLAYVYHRSFN